MIPLDLAYRARRWLLRVTRWRTRGVKVVVQDRAGRILLVRNTYGARDAWALPGGGIRRRESPEAAAAREVREETGCSLDGLTFVATFHATREGRRDMVHLFRAVTADVPIADGWEVASARLFAPNALPDGTTAATRRRLAELAGAPRDERW